MKKNRNFKKMISSLLIIGLCATYTMAQSAAIFGNVTCAKQLSPINKVKILLDNSNEMIETDDKGSYQFNHLPDGKYNLVFYREGFATFNHSITIQDQVSVEFDLALDSLQLNLQAIEIEAERRENYGLRRLRNVEGMAIYAAKKTEVIQLDRITANLATNNPRQVFKDIPGLNIWENDGAGLQLAIGARGLDPNRTSNFNTRQNGYDISADALGYPESYYTPPTQALKRIEIVRGAASLQYGPQFGGLLNFVFKEGKEKKPFEFITENTVGSFGLLTSFNSIGGSKDGWNYYTFYQRKQGDGWRENSAFHQNTAYAKISKKVSDRFKVSLEYTFMNYLAQQAGGLQDFEFFQNARQSKRARNWFEVNWNLAALIFDYQISDKTKINSRSFFLGAQRQALGELGAINRPDPLRERDLIRGRYRNFGNETRLIHRYEIGQQLTTFLAGFRYYQGLTLNQQGDANDSSDPDFKFLNPNELEKSEYDFPSKNISVFAENLFNVTKRWSITPGARFEYINTASDGFYKRRVFSGGELIFERKFEDVQENSRSFLLLGLGTAFKLNQDLELYGNFSQNYRSINFSDLAIVNPNLIVDSLLKDETGFNADLGIRGTLLNEAIRLDASLFYLQYKNRIGLSSTGAQAIDFRTNIGDARIVGLETYIHADIWQLLKKDKSKMGLSVFVNASLLKGKYTSGLSSFKGNEVELIPPLSLKTGLQYRWKNFRASYQFAHVAAHYSDASNAEFVVNATRGKIPAYQVQDLSFSYLFRRFRFQGGVNNLTNAKYFTRRANGYPGPGIIPADGRSFYLTFGVKF